MEDGQSGNRALALNLGALMIIALMGSYTVPLMIGGLVDGLGLTAQQAGTLGTLEIFSVAVSALALSGFVHRLSMRSLLGAAIFFCFIAQALSAFTSDYYLLAALRLLAGIAAGVVLAAVNSLIATSKSPETLYGWVLAASSSGFAILLAGLPFTFNFNAQQGLFLAIAVVNLLGLTLVSRVPDRVTITERKNIKGSSAQAIPVVPVASFFILLTLVYVSMGGVWSFTERVAVGIDVDRGIVGLLLGLSTVAGIAGASSSALIGTRLGLTVPILVGFMISGLSAVIVAQSTGVWGYALGLLLYGYIYMFTITFVLSLGAALDPVGRVAIATNGYLLIPYSLGPVTFGLIGISNISVLGWVSFAGCLLAALAIIPISRYAEQHRH